MATALRDIPLFEGLSQSDMAAVKSCLREKSFSKGEILFHEGKACERIFIVQTGRVKLYRMDSSGREQILQSLETGDSCACNPGSTVWYCASTAEALTPCKVWFLSRPDYARMVNSNPKIAHALNRVLAEKLTNLSCLLEEVSLKDVKKRVVKFLLDMYKADVKLSGKDQAIHMPFTREEIARRLGTARETVARNLSQLKQANLIDIKPKQIIIRDLEGLEKLLQ